MNKLIFVLLIIVSLASLSLQTKKVNCRKYVYAPVCRGVAAKRALPSQMDLEIVPKSFYPRNSILIDPRTPTQWNKDGNEKGLFNIMFRRFEQTGDYDNENYLN